MNIKQAQTFTIEALDAMTLEQLKEVAGVLATSKAKASRLKLDQIQIIIEKRVKEAKKAKDAKAVAETKAVENSVKSVKKNVEKEAPKKADKPTEEEEAEQTSLILDSGDDEEEVHHELLAIINESTTVKELKEFAKEYSIKVPRVIKLDALKTLLKTELGIDYLEPTPAPKEAPKETPKVPPIVTEAFNKLLADAQKQIDELKAENAKLKADIFPAEIEMTKGKLVATDFKEVLDVQKALIEKPYQVYIQVHEGLDDIATTFLVVFMNENKLILVDKSREKDTTLDLFTKDMTKTTVMIDKRPCPFKFYVKESK